MFTLFLFVFLIYKWASPSLYKLLYKHIYIHTYINIYNTYIFCLFVHYIFLRKRKKLLVSEIPRSRSYLGTYPGDDVLNARRYPSMGRMHVCKIAFSSVLNSCRVRSELSQIIHEQNQGNRIESQLTKKNRS